MILRVPDEVPVIVTRRVGLDAWASIVLGKAQVNEGSPEARMPEVASVVLRAASAVSCCRTLDRFQHGWGRVLLDQFLLQDHQLLGLLVKGERCELAASPSQRPGHACISQPLVKTPHKQACGEIDGRPEAHHGLRVPAANSPRVRPTTSSPSVRVPLPVSHALSTISSAAQALANHVRDAQCLPVG